MNVLKWLGYILLLGLFIWFVFFRKFNPFATNPNSITTKATQEILDENTTSEDTKDDSFLDEKIESTPAIDNYEEPISPSTETTQPTEQKPSNGINLNQKYLIVVGSFGKKANADKMLKRVLKDGNQGVITTINGLFRVVTSSTDDLTNAKKLRDHFTHIYKETAFILEN